MKNRLKVRTSVFVIILIVIIVAVNVLASILVDRFSLKLDTTTSGLYQISEETVSLMKQVNKQVDIYCICKSRDSIKEFSEMLNKYDKSSDFVSVTYVDPYTDTVFMDQLQEEGVDVGVNTIIVQCEGKRRVFDMADMYEFSTDGTELAYFNAESILTSAVVNVASDRNTAIGVVLGHGEVMPAEYQTLAVTNNFGLTGVVLNTPVSENIDILMVMAPQTDFSEDEIVKLDEFFVRGGTMAVFSDPSVPDLPVLDSFLSEWGIEFEDNVIFDASYNIESNPVYPILYYIDHEMTTYFATHQYYLVSPASRSLVDPFISYTGGHTLEAVLTTSDTAYARDINTDQKTLAKIPEDETGPFLVAVTSSMDVSYEGEARTARIFAMGSKRFYSDEMMKLSSVGNAKFMGQLLQWMDNDKGVIVSIPGKQVGAEAMAVTPVAAYSIGLVFVILIPLAIIILGVRVFLKRRHL